MNTDNYFTVIEYIDEQGRSPFARWYSDLDPVAKLRITSAIYKLATGNHSNSKSVGKGVYEFKINFGPGYRIYYALTGTTLVLLLRGGTKQRQNKDTKLAQQNWHDHKNKQV